MSFMVQYRGEIEDIRSLCRFEDCVLRLTVCLGGHAQLWRESAADFPERQTGGMLLFLAGGLEACSLIIAPDGMLIRPRDVEHLRRCSLPEAPWCEVETTLSGPVGHIMLLEVLDLMRTYWFPRLQIIDSTRYWQHRSAERLFREWDAALQSGAIEPWSQYDTAWRHWDSRIARLVRDMAPVLAFGTDLTLILSDVDHDSQTTSFLNRIRQAEVELRSSEFEATIAEREEHSKMLETSDLTLHGTEPEYIGTTGVWDTEDVATDLEEPIDLSASGPEHDEADVAAIRIHSQNLYGYASAITRHCHSRDGHAAAYDSHFLRTFACTLDAINMFSPEIRDIHKLSQIAAKLKRGQHSARCCRLATEGLRRHLGISQEKADVIIRKLIRLDTMVDNLVARCIQMGGDLQERSA